MTRSFFFVLSLLALVSCQPENSRGTVETPPPSRLAALQEKGQENITPVKTVGTEMAGETAPEPHREKTMDPSSKAGSHPVDEAKKAEQVPDAPAANAALTNVQASDVGPEQSPSSAITPEPATPAPPSHETWDALLRKYVSATGKVNYKGLLADEAKLQAYLDELAANPVSDSWSRDEKLAYWINAYNAFTVKLILSHYPIPSIMKIHDGKPWDVKWIKLGDKTYSLNNIENDIIRPRFKESRIHFAINCAARSCPPLLNRAWMAGNLNALLEQQTQSFINNPAFNQIAPKAVEISKIFEWYAADFGNIVEYLNKYAKTRIQESAKVSYKEYDWGLNE